MVDYRKVFSNGDRFTHGWRHERYRGVRIGTLWWNWDAGEADVTMSADFDELWGIAQSDALNDVIGLLERERDVLHGKDDEEEDDTDD